MKIYDIIAEAKKTPVAQLEDMFRDAGWTDADSEDRTRAKFCLIKEIEIDGESRYGKVVLNVRNQFRWMAFSTLNSHFSRINVDVKMDTNPGLVNGEMFDPVGTFYGMIGYIRLAVDAAEKFGQAYRGKISASYSDFNNVRQLNIYLLYSDPAIQQGHTQSASFAVTKDLDLKDRTGQTFSMDHVAARFNRLIPDNRIAYIDCPSPPWPPGSKLPIRTIDDWTKEPRSNPAAVKAGADAVSGAIEWFQENVGPLDIKVSRSNSLTCLAKLGESVIQLKIETTYVDGSLHDPWIKLTTKKNNRLLWNFFLKLKLRPIPDLKKKLIKELEMAVRASEDDEYGSTIRSMMDDSEYMKRFGYMSGQHQRGPKMARDVRGDGNLSKLKIRKGS